MTFLSKKQAMKKTKIFGQNHGLWVNPFNKNQILQIYKGYIFMG